MKKNFFSCFHPLVLETQSNHQINVDSTIIVPKDHNKKIQRNNSKRQFSQVLEILLLKASLKIKVSDRNCRQLLLQPKSATLRRISTHLQIKTRRDREVEDEEAKVSETEIRSSSPSSSLYESKNTRSSVEGRRPSPSFDHEQSREFRLMAKPGSCRINPGLYLFVATLFFTVVWGRVRAVLFALVFLYLFPAPAGFLR